MSKVTNATSMFTKLCWVSTLETPRAPHLALVSTGSGGIRPKIHPEAKGFSITVADGARPVSMVAWKQAAVDTSRAAQAMAAIGRIGSLGGWGESAPICPPPGDLANQSVTSSRRRGLRPPERGESVGKLDPDDGAQDQRHRAERACGDGLPQQKPAQEDGDHGIHVGVRPDDGRWGVLQGIRVGAVSDQGSENHEIEEGFEARRGDMHPGALTECQS